MPLGIYTLSVLVILSVTLSVLATLLVTHPVRTRHLVRLVRTRHPVCIVGYSVRLKEKKA